MMLQKKHDIRTVFNKNLVISVAPILGLALTVLFFAIMSDGRTISTVNLKVLVNQAVVTALVAIGATFVFTVGALDLSFGSCVGLSAICGALVGVETESFILMVVVTVGVSLLLALIKGITVAYLDLPVFIVTIVFGYVLSAIGLILLGTRSIVSVRGLVTIQNMSLLNVCFVVLFFLACLVLFNYTRIGKGCRLMGGNRIAARQSGISVRKNTITAFLISGVGVALAAVITILRTKTVSASTGGSLSLDVLVAIVLGGMPLSGGPRSRISAGLVGALTITVLNNGLNVVGFSTGSIQAVRGIIFILVAFLTSVNYRTNLLPR